MLLQFRAEKEKAFAMAILASITSVIHFFRRTSPLPQCLYNVGVTRTKSFLSVKFTRIFFNLPQTKKLDFPSEFFYFFVALLYIISSQILNVSFSLNNEAIMLSNARSEYGEFMNLLFAIFIRYHFTLNFVDLLHVIKANFANFLKTVKPLDCVFHCLLDLCDLPTIHNRIER